MIKDIAKVGNDKLLPNKCCTIPFFTSSFHKSMKPKGPRAGRNRVSGNTNGKILSNFGRPS